MFDTTDIERSLTLAVKKMVTCSVDTGRRNSTPSSPTAPFIVTKSVTELSDKGGFGKNICRIEIYVKTIAGRKDVNKISEISKQLIDGFPIDDGKYRFTTASQIELGLDNTGYDVKAININVLIK